MSLIHILIATADYLEREREQLDRAFCESLNYRSFLEWEGRRLTSCDTTATLFLCFFVFSTSSVPLQACALLLCLNNLGSDRSVF